LSTHPAPAFRFAFANTPSAHPEEAVDFAVRAERSGFDGFVMADLPASVAPAATLSAVARATTTITLGPFVLNTATAAPYATVRELATLDRLSGGRLEIGLGSGIPHPGIEEPLRSRAGARYERLRATVETLERALQDPEFTPGFQQKSPRLTIAVTGERALRLAARHAGTFIIASVPPVPKVELPRGEQIIPELAATARQLEQLRAEAGERAAGLEIGTGAPVIITDDAEAWAQEKAKLHTYLTPEALLASPKVLAGTVEQVADRILEYRERLGLTYYVFTRSQSPEELAPVVELVRKKAGQVVA
jgi:probable F420-dependent oxidoreductase